MKRRLFNVLTAVSLLLSIATVSLWVRSYKVADGVGASLSTRAGIHFESADGAVCAEWLELFPDQGWECWEPGAYTIRSDDSSWREISDAPTNINHRIFGFEVFAGLRAVRRADARPEFSGLWDYEQAKSVFVPYWFIIAIFSTLPLAHLCYARKRWRASKFGLCPECGYDLRATPQRCPECGTAVGRSDGAVPRNRGKPRSDEGVAPP